MSYDLRLIAVPEGVTPEVAWEEISRQEGAHSMEEWLATVIPEATQNQMQQLADALKKRWPGLVQGEPTRRLPLIELNEHMLQVQALVFPHRASIAMPFLRSNVREMWKCVWACIDVCREQRGYVPFDGQLGRVLVAEDEERVVGHYRDVERLVPYIQAGVLPKKAWWKFWG